MTQCKQWHKFRRRRYNNRTTSSYLHDGGLAKVSPSAGGTIGLGAISGYSDGTFGPRKNATRAEAVTVIVNALKL